MAKTAVAIPIKTQAVFGPKLGERHLTGNIIDTLFIPATNMNAPTTMMIATTATWVYSMLGGRNVNGTTI